jgi:hypothetical protein
MESPRSGKTVSGKTVNGKTDNDCKSVDVVAARLSRTALNAAAGPGPAVGRPLGRCP